MENFLNTLYKKDKKLAVKVSTVLGYKVVSKKLNLKGSIKKKIDKEIGDLLTPKNRTRYFKNIPLDDLFDILDKYGIVPLQEDNTKWSGMLVGREGKASIMLAPKDTIDGQKMYTPFNNTMLILTWYKMEPSGKYEVISYLS